MTDDTRSPEEIERDIERERAGLKETLDDLQDRFSVDHLVRQVSDQLRNNGGEIARSLSGSVKRNPMALALTGVGLAWLMMSDRSSDNELASDRSRRQFDDDDAWRSARPARAYGSGSTSDVGSQDRGGRSGYSPAMASSGYYSQSRNQRRDLPAWAHGTDQAGREGTETGTGSSASWDYPNNSRSDTDAGNDAGASFSERTSGAASAISDAGSSVADKARDLGRSASDTAASLRDRLAHGTESFSDEARDRVVAARQKAMEARDSAMRYAREGGNQAADLFEEQPLIAGALALALGAAIGAALPRSRIEDSYFGDYSDELMDEAERLFEEESQKLTAAARTAADAAKDAVADTGDTGSDVTGDAERETRSAGEPAAGTMSDEDGTQDWDSSSPRS